MSADPGQIEQVLMNLAVNARDAMPKGGTLTIETANVRILTRPTPGRHMAVKPGPTSCSPSAIPASAWTRPRRRGSSNRSSPPRAAGAGTGLGLSTVFGIVKQSGGSVEVYSEPGRGTP